MLMATMEPCCAGGTAFYGYYFSRRLPAGAMP
jgi:hypothetical protein